jgi:hypothetical protein
MKTILPIQFAFPNSKIPSLHIEKFQFFSDLSPMGQAKKYKFFIESEYYAHYAKAQFAVTMKKGGWDCLRHYEILASGTIPYFLDIENCPKNTLHMWPKDLLIEAKNLPGMPKEKDVIRALKKERVHELKPSKEFDITKYRRLREELMIEFHKNLTTSALSDYFISSLNLKPKSKVLLVFGVLSLALDYMRDLLITALAQDKRIELHVYPNPFWQLNTCHRSILNTLYGRGFTCTANLSAVDYLSPSDWREVEKSLNIYSAIVACSTSNAGFLALPEEVQKTLAARNDIIYIDGNDITADHNVPACAGTVFRREF